MNGLCKDLELSPTRGRLSLSLRLHTAQHILSSLVAILALSHSPPDREHNYFVIRIARTHIH